MRFKRESTAGTPGPQTFYAAESAIPETVCLRLEDEAAESHVGAHFSLADLDAIIAGLTDLRDVVRAKQGAVSDAPVQSAQPSADHIATAAAALRQLAIECVRDGAHDRAVRVLQFLDELEEVKTP